MDDLASHPNEPVRTPDLAAIVLGEGARSRSRIRSAAAPERVPVDLRGLHGEADGRYDGRSVLVLALVVAVLAAVVGWGTSLGDDGTAPSITTTAEQPATEQPAVAPTVLKPAAVGAASPPKGVDFVPGRIVATRSGSGGGIVRLAVANRGADSYDGAAGVQVLLLVDGEVAGSEPLGRLGAGDSATVEFALGYCPAGTPALVAVIDPAARVREADERSNSVSRAASFGC